eukprot:7236836-Prorocentrum_lima.AAC.1
MRLLYILNLPCPSPTFLPSLNFPPLALSARNVLPTYLPTFACSNDFPAVAYVSAGRPRLPWAA